MKWRNWLDQWDMTGLKVKASYLEMEWRPQEADRDAAWDLYIQLLTRLSSQSGEIDEKEELQRIYAMFNVIRDIIMRHGRDCIEFSKIAILFLNQVIRPFTAKWHKILVLDDSFDKNSFRTELSIIQAELNKFTHMLAEMAGVEDISDIGGSNG